MYERKFMLRALKCAQKAYEIDDVPVGCVIVHEGKVIASGYNRRENDKNALKHAEITAINRACRKLGGWRLIDCDMYVTLEPCPMCAGAIVQARVPRVVIGSMNPKAGCCGSVLDMLHEKRFNHRCEVRTDVEKDACAALMSDFFAALREQKLKKLENEQQADRS